MANYANLLALIAANVYENHDNEVTAEKVKAALNAVVSTLVAGGYLYKGVAHPGDPAITSDANIFVIATEAGTYTNFKNSSNVALQVADGEVAILKYNGSWSKESTGLATAAQVSLIPKCRNAAKISAAGDGVFRLIGTLPVFLRKGTSVRIDWDTPDLGETGWRIYANAAGQENLVLTSQGRAETGSALTSVKDYDITSLLFYSDSEGLNEFYIYNDFAKEEDFKALQTTVIGLSGLVPKVDGIIEYVGEPANKTTTGSASFSSNLAQIFSFTPAYSNGEISIIVSNISDQTVDRCVVYPYPGTTEGQKEATRLTSSSFGVTFVNNNYAGPIRVYLIGGSSGTCDYEVEESQAVPDTSLNARVTRLEEAPGGGSSPYKDMKCICMGDSHAVRRAQWVPRICDKIGAIYDAETSAEVVGPANEPGAGYEAYADSLLAQAVRAVEQYEDGKQIDLIIMDNVHYNAPGQINNAFPLKIKNIIDLGELSVPYASAASWFDTNIQSILSGQSPQLGTVVYAKLSNTKYRLTFSGTPQAGEMVLTLDGHTFNAIIENGDTLNQAVQKLGVWSFGDYTDWNNTLNGNSIDLTYKGSASEIPEPVISFSAGTTGLTMAQSTIEAYSDYRRYLQSYDIEDWLDPSKWVYIFNWFGYSALKGVYETLLEGIPDVTIICCALPCYGIAAGQFETDLGGDMKAFYSSEFYTSNRNRATTFMSAGEYYDAKVIDVEKLCGITLANWFTFNPAGDVHPNQLGYTRWADTIIRALI